MVCVLETIIKAKIIPQKREFKIAFDKKNDCLVINATKKPEKGKVNEEVLKGLRNFFNSEITLISGFKSNKKVLKIMLEKEEILKKLENTS